MISEYQTNLISFFDWVATLIDWENAVTIIYVNKVSDKVSHEVVNKVVNYGLNDPTVRWIYNWLTDHSHSSTLFSIISTKG